MRVSNPKNITLQDIRDLKQIARCGFVRIDLDRLGYGFLETGRKISPGRLLRLKNLDLIEPSGDSMFGVLSQTWRITPGTEVEKITKGPVERGTANHSGPEI